MEQVLTFKVRLKPTDQQSKEFEDVSIAYRDACNVVSQWYFDHHFNSFLKCLVLKLARWWRAL